MEIKFNIEDYIGADKIKEKVRDEVEYAIREKVNKALRAISISDIIYSTARKIAIEILEEQEVDLYQKIADKTLECVDELSLYHILRDDDSGEKSKGQQVLDECVEEARPKIQQKVNSIIEGKLNTDFLIDEVCDRFYSKLREQIIG